MKIAPVALFTYNRPNHLKRTIESLKKNLLAAESHLFIFSDGAKTDSDIQNVNVIRSYLKDVEGFKEITIIERDKNLGLANNIIDGVTTIVNKYDKIIMIEDDLEFSRYFLTFLNDSLIYYADNKKVWNISGWSPPFDPYGLNDTYFTRIMHCSGGWATWADRWEYYDRNAKKIMKGFKKKDIYHFNLDGTKKFWKQIKKNDNGTLNTWAIFWYATIFKNKGLCLDPSISYTKNIGYDSSATHTTENSFPSNQTLSLKSKVNYPSQIKESELALKKLKMYYKSRTNPLYVRIQKKIFSFF